jgi:NAD(P)-dependent dehydrogenase (short-subunit alcohol dehydrogenase family)
MKENVVVVTGATSGIGKATAEAIAKTGATTVLACRNAAASEIVAAEISAKTENPRVTTVKLDLASLTSVREAATIINESFSRVDVLINNAGVFSMKRQITEDGFELTMGVNHLGHFLFTSLLLDSLMRAPSARIVNVGSDAHLYGKIDFDNFFFEKRFRGFKAYASSRLATQLFTVELAERLSGWADKSHVSGGVTANSLHPGHVATNMWNLWPKLPAVNRAVRFLMKRFLITPAEGAATSVYLACSDEVQGVSGTYFQELTPAKANPQCEDRLLRQKLWEVSADLTGAGWPS